MSVSFLLKAHLIFMTVSFVIFALSFAVGIIFLIEEFRLKNHKLPTRWLPSLSTLDWLHYRVLLAGFVLLTVGIGMGAFLSKAIVGQYLSEDPRQIISLIIWSLYAFFLNARGPVGWKGRRGILLSALGFLGIILAFVAISHRM